MEEVILNKDNLKLEEINKIVRKVRAIIFDEEGKILINKYGEVYMLPGGKIDLNEKEEDALLRELEEETGISISNNELEPLVKVKTYARNYKERNGNIVNRLMETSYFVINKPKSINEEKRNLTESEIKGDFNLLFASIEEIELLLNESSSNVRKKYFDNELRSVLDYYKEIYIQSRIKNKKLERK